MSAAKATLTTVKNAVEEIEGLGLEPTIDRIIETVGGGSRGTVIKLLATLRGSPKQAAVVVEVLTPEIRKSTLDLAETITRTQRLAAESAFDEERRLHTEVIAKMVADGQRAGSFLEASEADLARALERNDNLEQQLAAKSAECDTLGGRLARANETIEKLEQLLKEADAAKPDHPALAELTTLMRGLDARLALFTPESV